MRGRKPKLKITKDDGPLRAPIAIPPCPDVLNDDARAEWKRVTGLLFDLEIIAHLDCSVVARYCVAYGDWQEARRQIAELGHVVKGATNVPVLNLWRQVAKEAAAEMQTTQGELGLSPAARARLFGVPKQKQAPLATGFEGVLANVG